MKKIIILNAGSRTRKAFALGVSNTTIEYYKTKEMILHIRKDLSCTHLYKNASVDFSDSYVFTRLRASDKHFCGILYEYFIAHGIKASDPINASFVSSDEKISQMPRLARAGISVPETIIAREESYRANKEYILKHLQFPCVFKTDGSQGNAVFKINSIEELDEKVASKKKHELFLVQELISNTYDTRTLVAYGEILGSIKRTALPGNFYNNVAKGASVEGYTLSAEETKVALKATSACKLDFGGVDIIHTQEGPVVLEVNKSPQIGGFESIHGAQSVFKNLARIIEKKMT